MARYILVTVLSSALLSPLSAHAETTFGAGVGTLGFNVTLGQSLTENINLRLSYNSADYDFDGETDGVNYDYGFDLSSFSAQIDWHPLRNGFRLSAGAISNGNKINAASKAFEGTVEIGDQNFTNEQVGRLEGDIKFDSIAPYLGLGWGRAADQGWGFLFDLGVAFQGSGDANLTAVDGSFSDNPLLIAEIEREELELEADIEDYDLYPVASFQLMYAF
ncbi:MAG: hypothetical protein AB8B48_12740 [Pseudomonadales bacterium]